MENEEKLEKWMFRCWKRGLHMGSVEIRYQNRLYLELPGTFMQGVHVNLFPERVERIDVQQDIV